MYVAWSRYTSAINICPDSAEHCAACHNGKATALGLTAQWEEAKASWAEASKLDPANAGYLHYQVNNASNLDVAVMSGLA